MTIKALAFDLDGTLLVGEDLPDSNRDALRRARDAGMAIIIATARWRQMARWVADEIGVADPCIACSGAQVFDPARGEDAFDVRLPRDFAAELFELCDRERCIATVTFDERVLIKMDGEPPASVMRPEMRWTARLAGADAALPRIAAVQGSAVVRTIREQLAPRYADSVSVYDSIGPNGKIILTITNKGANKGIALSQACRHLGIAPEEAVAFGDAENDIEMFRVAGASVAMGQAETRVLKSASVVSRPHDEGGVAHAVEHLLRTGTVSGLV
ncbi:MAG: HAD family hydrolase [Pseudomonadota bacterium]